MTAKLTVPVGLYLQGMDQRDLDRYTERLDELFSIVNAADDITREKDGKVRYQIAVPGGIPPHSSFGPDNYHEAVVWISECPGAPGPVINFEVRHSDEIADFWITEVLRPEDAEIDISNFDAILDYIDRLTDETEYAFTARGHVGLDVLRRVQGAEARASELLNAVVHAYMEFDDDFTLTIAIELARPYGMTNFVQVLGENRYIFLSEPTRAALDALMPNLTKLQYSAAQSICHYWLSPPCHAALEVNAKTLPDEDELVKTLSQISDIPAPHILDEPVLLLSG